MEAAPSTADLPADAARRVSAIAMADPRFADHVVTIPHPQIAVVRHKEAVVVIAPARVWERGRDALRPFAAKLSSGEASLVLLGLPFRGASLAPVEAAAAARESLHEAQNHGLSAILSEAPAPDELFVALYRAFERMEARARAESRGKWLNRYRYELGELIEIAKALTTERQIDKLLGLILEKSRFVTGADAGSIYVVETHEIVSKQGFGAQGRAADPKPQMFNQCLRFKLSQNESRTFDSREFTVPVSPRSMAGSVAMHKTPLNIEDVYALPAEAPYAFDRSFDTRTGYRTKSMLCAPLLSRGGETIGVIQLINKKREPDKKLLTAEDVETQVTAFDERSEALLMTLASQAGIALENAILYAEIERMLEGFVRASVEAIEQRDPTTSGHSLRVADLTVGLARAVERAGVGPYRGLTFSKDDLRELEYASLLHDFGKIGVREEVLVKAKKLYPHELDRIRDRFALAIRAVENDVLSRKVHLLEYGAAALSTRAGIRALSNNGDAVAMELKALDAELMRRREELTQLFHVVVNANEPTVLKGGDFERLETLARETYADMDGALRPLLTPEEVACLSVAKGSLTPTEIVEIRSHVSHTYEFLSKIPWGKQFRRVATIAGSHHERLNGTGYPNRLQAEEIPVQSKMMSIADIFDALTASDRPYKKAVPVPRALDILGFEVKDGHIDADLVKVFIEAQIWKDLKSFAGS